jgi:hypothetical protein
LHALPQRPNTHEKSGGYIDGKETGGNKVRSTKYEGNCCREVLAKGTGTALRFGNGAPKKSDDWDECSVHICPSCSKALQTNPLDIKENAELYQSRAVKQQLIKLIGIPSQSSWEPIYEFVRDQMRRYQPDMVAATLSDTKND